MKFFKNRKALTLVELIISIIISAVLFSIITVLITDSVNNLSKSDNSSSAINQIFDFKNDLNKMVRSGFIDIEVFTGATTKNNILYLKNQYLTEGILLGVVDTETNKLQQNYTYGDNFLGYRMLSEQEIQEIELDNIVIYDKVFLDDKIYRNLRIKDFIPVLYNSDQIIDIDFSVLITYDNSLKGENIGDIFIPQENIIKYNLVF